MFDFKISEVELPFLKARFGCGHRNVGPEQENMKEGGDEGQWMGWVIHVQVMVTGWWQHFGKEELSTVCQSPP